MRALNHSSGALATIVLPAPDTISTMVANTYQERLNTAMTAAGMDTATLAAKLGVSYQAVRKAQDGRSKSMSASNNAAAAAALGVSPDWLATGKGAMRPQAPALHPDSNALWETRRPVPRHLVPVVGSAKLGDEGFFVELEYPVGHGDGYIDFPTDDPHAYALRCAGTSMLPRIKPGEYACMEPSREVHPGDEVLVRSTDGRVMIKELLYVRDGHVHLGSINDNHPKISIPLQEIEKMHHVAGVMKRSRWTPDYEPERRREDVTPNPQRRIGEENWQFPGGDEKA